MGGFWSESSEVSEVYGNLQCSVSAIQKLSQVHPVQASLKYTVHWQSCTVAIIATIESDTALCLNAFKTVKLH